MPETVLRGRIKNFSGQVQTSESILEQDCPPIFELMRFKQ